MNAPAGVDAVTASGALPQGLEALARRGRMTPCQSDPPTWFAEHRAQQAIAVEACGHCPLLEPCRGFADVTARPSGSGAACPDETDRTLHPQEGGTRCLNR